MKKISILLFWFVFLQFHAYSQEKIIKNLKISTYFGIKDIQRDSFPSSENIDFVNYLYSEKEYYGEYTYLGFSASFDFKEKWSADIKMAMLDDYIPKNLNVTFQYFPWKNIGINFGFYGHSQFMNEYSTFHEINDENFMEVDENYNQSYPYDYGVLAGFILNKKIKKASIILKINTGINSIMPFKESLLQKKINENERRKTEYQTKTHFNLFLFPELELNIDCISLKGKAIGIQFQTNYYISKKSINYERTVYKWTEDNYTTDKIIGAKHNFTKIEFDFGIYIKW